MKVFVYGTLRKGEVNSYLLNEAKCILENCWTYGQLYDSGEGYPAMILSSTCITYGELYEVTKDQLKVLDELEEFKEGFSENLYNRVEIKVYSKEDTFNAYVYIANQEVLLKDLIVSGDWKSHYEI